MTRARKTVRDSVGLIGAQGATTLAGALFIILAARWMTDVEMAALAAWEILVAALRVVASLGLVGTLTQRVPVALANGDLPLVRGYMRLGLVSQAVVAVPAAGAIGLMSAPISKLFFDTPDQTGLVWLLAVAALSGRIYDQLSMLLSPLDRFKTLTGCRLAHDVVLRLLALTTYAFAGMAGFFATIVCGEVLISVVAVLAARRAIFGGAVTVPIRSVLRYSLPFYWNGFLRFAVMQADQLAVSALLGPHALATYFLARRLSFFLESLVNHLVAPLVPKLSALRAHGTERLGRAVERSARLTIAVLVPATAYVAILSGMLVEIVGGGAYAGAAPVLATLCAVALLYGLSQIYTTVVFVAGSPSATLRLSAVAGVTSVGSVMVLGAWLGIWGVALSRVLTQLVIVLAGHRASRTIVRSRLDGLAALRALGGTAASALPVVFCLVSGWHEPISVPVALVVSGSLSTWLALRALSVEDRELLRASVPEWMHPWMRHVLRETSHVARAA